MKEQQHSRHLQQLEMILTSNIGRSNHPNNQTQQDLIQNISHINIEIDESQQNQVAKASKAKLSKQFQKSKHSNKEKDIKENKKEKINRKYNIFIHKYLFQIILAYCLVVPIFYLQAVLSFPIFQLITIAMLVTFFDDWLSWLFILLAIPIFIGSIMLEVELIGYCSAFVCYLSTSIITEKSKKRLLWIIQISMFGVYGFILIPLIYNSLQLSFRYYFYYSFPFLNGSIKLLSTILRQGIEKPSNFILEYGVFILGLQFGVLMSIPADTIEFWFVLIFLTLDIVNVRFRIIWRLLARCFKIKNDFEMFSSYLSKDQQSSTNLLSNAQNTINPISSGFISLQTLHIVVLVYMIFGLRLSIQVGGTVLSYSLQKIKSWYLPLVIYVFYALYEAMALIKLRYRQNLVIYGFSNNEWKDCMGRGFGHLMGFWFFFLGMAIALQTLI